jgi:hypothetical protein
VIGPHIVVILVIQHSIIITVTRLPQRFVGRIATVNRSFSSKRLNSQIPPTSIEAAE